MEETDCENCRTWEEEMYWKHFNSIHFYQILSKNFHDHLVLPEKFSAHMKTQVPDKVSLRGPNGTVSDIKIQKTDNLLLVGDGWKDFVKTYELEENSLLMFKYKQNSSVEVLIFDQASFCEKEASYFVKKCNHTKYEQENRKKRTVGEGSSTELVEDEEDDGSAFVALKKSRKDAAGDNGLGIEENTPNPRSHTSNGAAKKKRGRPRKMVVPCNPLRKSKVQPNEKPGINEVTPELIHISLRDTTTPENGVNIPPEIHADKSKDQSVKSPSGNGTVQELSPISGADWSTPEDGEDFSEMNDSHRLKSVSVKEPSENGTAKNTSHFSTRGPTVMNYKESSSTADDSDTPRNKRGRPKKTVTPRRASSGKRYPEYISSRRVVTVQEKEDALQKANQKRTGSSFIVVMRPSSVYKRFYMSIPAEWMNKNLSLLHQEFILRVGNKTWQTTFYYNGKRGVGGLCGGWKKFALENLLEEFDVLLFELANPNEYSTIIFDVEIFRVIPPTLPPLLGVPPF